MTTQPPESREVLRPPPETTLPRRGQISRAADTRERSACINGPGWVDWGRSGTVCGTTVGNGDDQMKTTTSLLIARQRLAAAG